MVIIWVGVYIIFIPDSVYTLLHSNKPVKFENDNDLKQIKQTPVDITQNIVSDVLINSHSFLLSLSTLISVYQTP